MHISLDSALGRQRRLNSVGESVLQIAPNAAAAYSLRSLTGGDPKVVRVRRGSDNHEQDFTASEVSSGALTSFVNAQVVAPLDIQALSATGRDGDFLIAKAAYSLRSLGTRQASVAAFDTDVTTLGKYVVQVRRSSDDALKSFTADEVTDGTLLSFANPTYTVGTSVESASKPFDSFTSNGNDGFTATNNTTGSASAGFPYTFATGDVISVSFDLVVANNATPTFMLSGNNLGSGSLVFGTTFTSSGSYTQEVTSGSGTGTHIAFTEGNTGTFTISNFKVTSHKADGFVKTWYDQSVTTQAGDTATGNHAVQATAAEQPKIVNAGSLIADGIEFDGSDDTLTAASVSGFGATISMFEASVRDGGGAAVVSMGSSASTANTNFGIIEGASVSNVNARNTTSITASASVSGTTRLTFGVTTGQTSTKSGALGGTLVEDTSDYGSDFTSGELDTIFLGKLRPGSGTTFDGHIREAIIYDTDQSDNRTAIEANIGEAYSIDLPSGVDPGFDQVDGFVETWYDQSGNSEDAVQETAGSQPKIVSAGALVANGLDFDGSDDKLDMPNDLIASINSASSFLVAKSDTTSGSRIALALSHSTSNFRFYAGALLSSKLNFGYQDTALKIELSSADTNKHLFTSIAGSSNVEAFLDGTSKGTVSSVDGKSTLSSGGIGSINTGNFWSGTIEEVIVYNTDQSANRVALETNIQTAYPTLP